MSERTFSVTRLMQYFAEHDPFCERVPFSKVNELYLWFEPNGYEKFKFKQKQNYSYNIKPIALTSVYHVTESNKRTLRKTFVYHEKLLNIFNEQQLVIIMDETKTRKIPNSNNLLYLSNVYFKSNWSIRSHSLLETIICFSWDFLCVHY